MPTVTTNYFRQELAAGNVNLSGDTFAVALMNYIVTANELDLKYQMSSWNSGGVYGPVSAFESSSVGYSAITLSNTGLTLLNWQNISWSGTNISWSNITNSPYGLCIYRLSDGLVVGFIDFGEQKEVVNGTLTIEWNTGGIAQII